MSAAINNVHTRTSEKKNGPPQKTKQKKNWKKKQNNQANI